MFVTMHKQPKVCDPLYFFNEKSSVHCLAFASNRHLLTGNQDGCITVWDLKTQRSDACLSAGPSQCLGLSVVSDSFLSQDKSGLIKWWAKDEVWKERKSVRLDFFGFCRISASMDFGGIVLCPCANSKVKVLDKNLQDILCFAPEQPHSELGTVMACSIVNTGAVTFVVVAYENCELLLWDYRNRSMLSRLKLPSEPLAIDIDEGGKGVCGTTSTKIPVFQLEEGSKLTLSENMKLKNPGVNVVKIHKPGAIVAAGCWDGRIRIYSWVTLKLLHVLSFHAKGVEDICFSAEGDEVLNVENALAAGSTDNRISIWNTLDFHVTNSP